jgi:hypothetical protein
MSDNPTTPAQRTLDAVMRHGPALTPGVGSSVVNALGDIATLLDRGALTPAKAAQWLRSLVEFIRYQERQP